MLLQFFLKGAVSISQFLASLNNLPLVWNDFSPAKTCFFATFGFFG